MPRLSVVVPAFNEAPIVPELVARLRAVLGPLEPDYEVILVDDGSRDATWQAIVEAGRADPRIRGLELSRNFGQHCAITAGLDRCDGDWVVVMDGDLQDQPEEIPRLVAKAGEGFDVVLARRTGRRDPAPKRLASWLFYRVFNYFTGRRYDGRVGNFRIMSRQVVENLRTMREQLRFLGGMIDWMGFRQGAIDVRHAERPSGRGAYNFARLWHLAQEIIIAYSDKPLRLAIRLGFLISLVAFVYGVFIVIQALRHGIGVAGWPSLIVSVYFLGGIIISILGIIGIYLGRTFAEAKRRPLYVIRSRSNPKD
jgi:dolichol-phosphate mannosyltransferase